MASPKRAVQLGPFMKGLNTFSDPSAVPDDGLAELLNMELDLDGSLVSRPPFHDTEIGLPLDSTGNMVLLGLRLSEQREKPQGERREEQH